MADIEKMRSDLDEKQQKAEASKEERAQLLNILAIFSEMASKRS